ncbi:30S ribosomal protein S4 [Methylophilaceae bacterium]|jgi:small subunit ribosomal protein S4|nr:30S ribosomal protein S4 [Methylophilaceae bacterium]MDC1173514.1 30S ribosomal protein S4 [Methylophilaceae bacterium]|tara:strand:+ start:98 stop:724 length:627 start_codon:yes stop_codon:yes gene_type:complete
MKTRNPRNIPKNKLSRQMGENIWGKENCPTNSRTYGPGQHGPKGVRRRSDYGVQLREKQKLKGYYGNIGEKQFRNIFKEAFSQKGDTSENLLILLESRLDSIVYRANLVPTVFAARQFVNHKHLTVNGVIVNIPSYRCKPGDIIEVREKSRSIPLVVEAMQKLDRELPEYITLDTKAFKVSYVRYPDSDEIPYATIMSPTSVVEFYSR